MNDIYEQEQRERDESARVIRDILRIECPFSNPEFSLEPTKPCPVCGDLGTSEPNHCVG